MRACGSAPSWAGADRPARRASADGRWPALLRLDVGRANGLAVFVVALANERREIRAAGAHGIEALGGEPLLDLGQLERGGEPAGELGERLLRRLRRRDHAEPVVHFQLLEA